MQVLQAASQKFLATTYKPFTGGSGWTIWEIHATSQPGQAERSHEFLKSEVFPGMLLGLQRFQESELLDRLKIPFLPESPRIFLKRSRLSKLTQLITNILLIYTILPVFRVTELIFHVFQVIFQMLKS